MKGKEELWRLITFVLVIDHFMFFSTRDEPFRKYGNQ